MIYCKHPKVIPWAYIRIKAIFDGLIFRVGWGWLIFGLTYIRKGLGGIAIHLIVSSSVSPCLTVLNVITRN